MNYIKKILKGAPLLVCILVSWGAVAGVKYLPQVYEKLNPKAQEETAEEAVTSVAEESDLLLEETKEAVESDESGDDTAVVSEAGLSDASSEDPAGEEASGSAIDTDETKQKKIKPKYLTYEKISTDSPWYTDPGKIPLTTEYNYSKVKKDYFDDAVFIGDSRIVGMQDYSGLDNATFFAKTGLTIYDLWDDEFVEDPDSGKTVSIGYMLQNNTYGKIYLMVGINELGTGGTDYFKDAYKKVLHKMRKCQPDAIIYVQSIMGVSPSKDRSDEVFNNTNIRDKNCAIAELTDGIHIFYLNIQEVYEDEDHALKQELTFDDVHLYATHYDAWVKYLKNHAVVEEDAK